MGCSGYKSRGVHLGLGCVGGRLRGLERGEQVRGEIVPGIASLEGI